MTGSGGGGGGGFPPDDVACDQLVMETQISSPKAAVIAKIKLNDVLDVVCTQTGGMQTVQVLKDGEVAGGLTANGIAQLRECINAGTQYGARVIQISGGQVKVRVTAV